MMENILLDTMFDLPSFDGVDEVLISQQVVEGTAGPLHMYAARAGGARATCLNTPLDETGTSPTTDRGLTKMRASNLLVPSENPKRRL